MVYLGFKNVSSYCTVTLVSEESSGNPASRRGFERVMILIPVLFVTLKGKVPNSVTSV